MALTDKQCELPSVPYPSFPEDVPRGINTLLPRMSARARVALSLEREAGRWSRCVWTAGGPEFVRRGRSASHTRGSWLLCVPLWSQGRLEAGPTPGSQPPSTRPPLSTGPDERRGHVSPTHVHGVSVPAGPFSRVPGVAEPVPP